MKLSLVLGVGLFSLLAVAESHAARPVPFTLDEVLDILDIKRWKFERVYREPVKGVQVAIVCGRTAPNGTLVETEMPNPFAYQPPTNQTRFVVGLVLLENTRMFRTMIDGLAMEVPMPTDFKYDYEDGNIYGVEDGDLLILSYIPRKKGEVIKSKYQLQSYFALKITAIR
jgi:hypothetical protein